MFPVISRPQVKPKLWGPPDQVSSAIRDWCENKLGAPMPVLVMPIWEGAGTTLFDYSGKNYHGVFIGDPLYTYNSIFFDGDNDYISCGDCLPHTGIGSIVASLTPFDLGGDDEGIISNRVTDGSRWVQTSLQDDRLAFVISGSDVDENTVLHINLNATKFSFAATWETNIALKLYVNGLLRSQNTSIGDATPTSTDPIFLGSYYDLTSKRSLKADFYYAYIFNIVLSQDQIALINEQPYAMFEKTSQPVFFLPSATGNFETSLLDGKVRLKDLATLNFDGKVIVGNKETNLLDGKTVIEEITAGTNLFDGKAIVKSEATNLADGLLYVNEGTEQLLDGLVEIHKLDTKLLDGKIWIKIREILLANSKVNIRQFGTNLLDGKVIVLSDDAELVDGKIHVHLVNMDLVDGKVMIETQGHNLIDGKVQVKTDGTDLVDGKIQLTSLTQSLLDGKLVIGSYDADILDGKVIIQGKTTDLLDGKVYVNYILDTNLLNGKVDVIISTSDLLDGSVEVLSSKTRLLDGKINLKDTTIKLLDGKVAVRTFTPGQFDGLLVISNLNLQLLDGKVLVLEDATGLLETVFKSSEPNLSFNEKQSLAEFKAKLAKIIFE